MTLSGLDEIHAKVTSFISMFKHVKEKLDGKPKTAEMNLVLLFKLEKEPLEIEINYYLKNSETNHAGIVIDRVIC